MPRQAAEGPRREEKNFEIFDNLCFSVFIVNNLPILYPLELVTINCLSPLLIVPQAGGEGKLGNVCTESIFFLTIQKK